MPNNSKPANTSSNLAPAGKLEGTGLAGENGDQAKSANKMNIVANKLIKALNKYMESPKETSKTANKQNVANASALPIMTVLTANKSILNKSLNNTNSFKPVANNTVNVINHFEQISNKSKKTPNYKENNVKPNNKSMRALNTRKNRAAFMKTPNFKGGRRTTYNVRKSHKNRK